MRSIAFLNAKGGCAKTTSVLNLAAGLAGQGRAVLVVDSDPQANASHVLLRGEPARRPSLLDVLTAEAEAHDAIVPSAFDGVDVLPADSSLADAANVLANEVGRERRLRVAMEAVEDYDVVLFDTPPTRSLLVANVLNCAREVIIPVAPSLFGILGLAQLQSDVAQVRRFLDNKDIAITGIVLVMVERTNVLKGVEAELRTVFGDVVCRARIPKSLKLEEAHARHQSIFQYAPKSPGAKAYAALVEEVLSHGREANRDGDSHGHPSADHAA